MSKAKSRQGRKRKGGTSKSAIVTEFPLTAKVASELTERQVEIKRDCTLVEKTYLYFLAAATEKNLNPDKQGKRWGTVIFEPFGIGTSFAGKLFSWLKDHSTVSETDMAAFVDFKGGEQGTLHAVRTSLEQKGFIWVSTSEVGRKVRGATISGHLVQFRSTYDAYVHTTHENSQASDMKSVWG